MVKIGYTTGKLSIRKAGIQTMSPLWLYNLGVIYTPGDVKKMEKEMHELFAPYRVWGEWFEFPTEYIGTLKRCLKLKKKSRRSRENKMTFESEIFKDYWRKEIGSI